MLPAMDLRLLLRGQLRYSETAAAGKVYPATLLKLLVKHQVYSGALAAVTGHRLCAHLQIRLAACQLG